MEKLYFSLGLGLATLTKEGVGRSSNMQRHHIAHRFTFSVNWLVLCWLWSVARWSVAFFTSSFFCYTMCVSLPSLDHHHSLKAALSKWEWSRSWVLRSTSLKGAEAVFGTWTTFRGYTNNPPTPGKQLQRGFSLSRLQMQSKQIAPQQEMVQLSQKNVVVTINQCVVPMIQCARRTELACTARTLKMSHWLWRMLPMASSMNVPQAMRRTS